MPEFSEARPNMASLHGKTVLITAPQDSALRMAQLVQQRGGHPLVAPLIERVPLPVETEHARMLDRLAEYRWIIFTSGGAVERFFDEIEARGAAGELASGIIVAIGSRTQFRIEQRGYRTGLVAGENRAEGVVAALAAHGLAKGDRALFPCADNARQYILDELGRCGIHVDVLPLYTIAPHIPANLNVALSLLREEKIDALTFTSPAAARQFYRCFPVPDLQALARPPLLCAIGATTAAALEELGMRADIIPAQADAESMIATLAESLAAQPVSPSTEQ